MMEPFQIHPEGEVTMKKSLTNRITALLLTLVMVFTSSPVSTMASETSLESETAAVTAQTQAATEAKPAQPETPAQTQPETPAQTQPETKAAETQAATETKTAETQAATEAKAAETQAATEAKKPETQNGESQKATETGKTDETQAATQAETSGQPEDPAKEEKKSDNKDYADDAHSEKTVRFISDGGAYVTVDNNKLSSDTYTVKSEPFVYKVLPYDGYEVVSVLVDGSNAEHTVDGNGVAFETEYIIHTMRNDTAAVSITTRKKVEEVTEQVSEIEETETETVTVEETESELETETETETETESEKDDSPIVLTGSDGGYSVEVTVPAEALENSADDYELAVAAVAPTQKQIDTLESKLSENLPGGIRKEAHVSDVTILDIKIVEADNNSSTVQPQGGASVEVSITNESAPAEQLPEDVAHFADNGRLKEMISTDSNSFETSSFSEFTASYTVDFSYEGFEYKMSGNGEIKLSELADILGITTRVETSNGTYSTGAAFAADVSEVTVNLVQQNSVVNSDEFYAVRSGNDWILKSESAFSNVYELVIEMNDGTTVVVNVTDAKESSDLTDFLKNAVISGATQNADGAYSVEANKEYTIALTFAEGSTYQFDNDAILTYTMPAGITVPKEQSGELKINIVYAGKTYQVDATYNLDTNGNLTIQFDQDDPDYSKLVSSTNVSFRFNYEAYFDGSEEEIKFSDEVERDIVFEEEEPGEAFASKTATYDETTGTFTYTITVTADGDVANVNVKDVISGDAITFNNDVKVSVSKYTDNGATNGFDYTFPSMADGEVITITYTGTVDFSKDSDNDGKITADQTKNTVTVEPEDGPPHNSEYSREISYKTTKKSNGTDAGTTADGDKIIEWTITYNELCLASAAGDTIKDTISSGSTDYMKYYGGVITVKVYDKNGTPVETRNVSYSNLTSYSDSSWTYTIPSTDTTPYMYEITYQTVVDQVKVDGGGTAVTVSNDANGSGGSAQVGPASEIGVTKAVESSSTSEVTWVSTITVPEGGLAQAVVTDTVPSVWLQSRVPAYDFYKDGSLTITGLLDGESYDVDTSDTSKVVITFYKDSGKSETGLQGTSGGHTITIKLTTTVDQDWLQAGYDNPGYLEQHTNNISFNGKTAQATAIFGKPGIEKTGEKYTGSDSTGKTYTGIMYSVRLSGISEVPVSVEDTFDTSILEVDTSKSIYIYGGNQYYQGSGATAVSYSETSSGILLTANSVPMDSDGNYYPYYRITYYLKLKDGVDLEKLAQQNGGEYTVTNTAKWGDHESSYGYTTEYDYLDKQLLNEGALGGTNRTAQYKITYNPAKATLNGGNPVTMTDVLSASLSLDYSSISITTDPEGASVSYVAKGNDDGGTTVTYTIPDEISVTITYSAMVVGNGSVTITNKASVNGKDKTSTYTKDYGSAAEGEGAVASFKIVKVDGYDASKKLEGVQFKIFCENPTLAFDKQGTKEIYLTTDANGEIVLDGSKYDFYFGERYRVQEVDPLDDYAPLGFDYLVTLTNEMSGVDYGHYIYYYSDSMQIKNWPLEGLVVQKQVESEDEEDLDANYRFRISILNEDGTVNTNYNETNGDDTFVKGVVNFELKNNETKMFWGFAKGTKYKVEEIDSKGLATTVSYSVYDEDGNVTSTETETATSHTGELTQDDETILFTNKKEDTGSLKLKKVVTDKGEETTGTVADGNYTFTIAGPTSADEADQVSKTVVITITNGVMASAAIDGDTATIGSDGYVEVTGLAAGDYTITETAPTNGTALIEATGGKSVSDDNVVTVIVVAGGTGEDVAEEGKASFTNNKPDVPSFEKKIMDTNDTTGESSDWQDSADYDIGDEIPFKLTATLASDVSSYQSYSITFEDQMEASLTFKEVQKVVLIENNEETKITGDSVITPNGKHKFTVSTGWGKNYSEERMPITETLNGATVEVYFTATLNSNAKIGSDGNVNAARLHYSNNPSNADSSDETPWNYVIAFTYKLDVNKVDQDGNALTGAEFTLEKKLADGGTKSITLSQNGNVFTGTGLDDGNYVLTETKTPAGHKTIDPIEFTVNADHTVKWNYNSDELDFEGSTDRTAILTALTGDTESGDLVFTTPQQVSGLVGTVTNLEVGALKIQKNVTGTTARDKIFSFEVTLTTPEGVTLDESYPAKKNGQATTAVTVSEGKVSGITLNANEYFEILDLPVGTTYVVSEVKPLPTGYTEGTHTGTSGTIAATEKTAVMNNSYAAEGEIVLGAKKAANANLGDRKFQFKLADAEGAEIETSAAVKQGETVTFTSIPVSAAGEYTYQISEVIPEGVDDTNTLDGVTYDTTVATVIVKAEDDEKGGFTITYDGKETFTTPEFSNTYAAEGEAELKATKAVEGNVWPEGAKATFTVTADDGVPMPEKTSVVLTAAGEADFGKITYTQEDAEKTYTYTITESGEGFGDGWSANPAEITATVTVGDDKGDGTLAESSVEYDPEDATITNSYETRGEITFSGTKTLENRKLTAGEFTFELYEGDGTDPIQTVTNAEDGSYSFTKIEYTGDDLDTNADGSFAETTKTYKVVEKAGEDASVTYDTTEYEITVTLTDDGKGTIKAVADPEADTYDFTNTYTTKGNITFSGKKTLENKTLKEGEFSFELYDSEGKLLETVTNKADGTYSFTQIDYTGDDLDKDEEGYYVETTKKYKVVEKAGSIKGVTYDETKYDITVTLKDDEKGTIATTATPEKNTYDFTNVYDATGKVKIKAKKAISGAGWPKGVKVTFTVTAKDGVPMPDKTSVTLTEPGTADFGEVVYTLDDAGNTYTYTIKETSGFGHGWTAKPDTITVKVVVGKDNGDGTLKKCKVTYSPDDATIRNTYSDKKPVKTGDETPIAPYLILFLGAAMIILAETIRRLRKRVIKK